MTTAEKLTQVAKNVDKVYSAGQSSMVDENKIIKKEAKGVGSLHLNDVSEIPHKIDCKVESVNLFSYKDNKGNDCNKIEHIGEENNGQKSISIPLPAGTYTFSLIVTSSYEGSDKKRYYRITDINKKDFKTGYFIDGERSQVTFTSDEDIAGITLYYAENNQAGYGCSCTFSELMLNRGTEALPYTPYVNPEDVTVTVCGKNLFDINAFACDKKTETQANLTAVDVETGSIIITTPEGYSKNGYLIPSNVILRDLIPNVSAGMTCWINAKSPSTRKRIYLYNVESLWEFNKSRTLTEEDLNSRISWYGYDAAAGDGVGDCTISNIMVTTTSDVHPYVPYSAKTYPYETIKDMASTHETSPIMNIIASNPNVNITVNYNKSYGMQTEYDRFWDTFYNRSSWAYAFYGVGWTDVNYNPPKSIEPIGGTNAISMFHNALITDTKVPIKLSGATGANTMFYGCSKLETIRSITFGTSTLTNTFYSCTSLKNIEITEKCVVQNIDLHWCTLLTKESITSIINALGDEKMATDKTLTLSKTAVNNAFETSEGAADDETSEEWNNLISTKTNWDITLL